MSWNPIPTIGSANWQGNAPLVTKNQLLSSITGVENQVNALSFSTISTFNTVTALEWMSTPVLYVSDIQGARIDISGVSISPGGLLNAPVVSLSSLEFKAPTININVQFNVGDAVSGFLTGLGFLIFETLLGLGAGIGAAAQGIGNGIAAMIMARGSNTTYINNNTFELMNGATQLQVSTLGNAYPLYSTITRFVSSVGPNQVPGPEIFISTFFSPGQICIRAISDPFPMVTGNANVNTCTIQQFGQWTPLTGLEPEDIVANSISTNTISSGFAFAGLFYGEQAAVKDVFVNTLTLADSNVGLGTQISLGYDTPLKLTLGSLGEADILGSVNYLWMQSDQDIVFSKPGDTGLIPIAGSIQLGNNTGESTLNFSTVNANINASNAIIQNLLVTNFSTINSVTAINTLSSAVVETDVLYALQANISSISAYSFASTNFGFSDNRFGPYSIKRNDLLFSTTYNQISSITQNILQSQLNIAVNTQTSNTAAPYQLISPDNVEQWASTCFIWTNANINGGVQLADLVQWSSPTATVKSGTFDLVIQGTQPSGVQPYRVVQDRDPGLYPSTFVAPVAQAQGYSNSYRFTLPANSNGWWQMTSPAPPPYTTLNSNALSIWQDINDTYIEGTDRLHLKAGDIFIDGTINLNNVGTLTAGNVYASNIYTSNTYTSTLFTSTGIFQSYVSTPQILTPYNYYGGLNFAPNYTPINVSYNIQSTDFQNLRNLTNASRGWNGFTYQNLNEWNGAIYNTLGGTTTVDLPVVVVGESFSNAGSNSPPVPYSGEFWINNTTSPPTASFFPIRCIKPGGQGVLSTIGIASRNTTGYTRVFTNDGSNWNTEQSATNPSGSGASISNQYSINVNKTNTVLTVGQPYIENVPSKTIFAEKITNYVPQIRVYTNAGISFQSREAGMEYNTYFDQSIVFLGGNTYSDAVNLIVNPLGNLYYPLVGWTPMTWISRIRTATFGIQGFDISPIAVLASGTIGDYVWASARYLNVNDTTPVGQCDIRENYLMIPTNYMTYNTFVGPY